MLPDTLYVLYVSHKEEKRGTADALRVRVLLTNHIVMNIYISQIHNLKLLFNVDSLKTALACKSGIDVV